MSYAQRHGQNRPQQQLHVRRHKHTQSEVHGPRQHGSDSLPHLTAGLVAERRRQDSEKQRATDFLLGPRAQELRRMASTRSYRQGEVASTDGRNDLRNELRRRATSDPKTPSKVVKSPIENALDKAYEKKLARIGSVTQKDVDRMKVRSAEAEEELRSRLDYLVQMSMDITRRLDYTYYSLLERIGSLVSTIHSFQSLSTQSRALVEGFEKEAEHLDTDIKRKIGRFRDGFEEREARIAELEQRGTKAGNKAVQLGKRLESARIIVEDWEKRESGAMRARARMWRGTWFACGVVLLVIITLVLWKEGSSGADAVKAGLSIPEMGDLNQSLRIDGEVLREKKIPEHVQSILHGIETRRSQSTWTLPASVPVETAEDDDKRLRALDEL